MFAINQNVGAYHFGHLVLEPPFVNVIDVKLFNLFKIIKRPFGYFCAQASDDHTFADVLATGLNVIIICLWIVHV